MAGQYGMGAQQGGNRLGGFDRMGSGRFGGMLGNWNGGPGTQMPGRTQAMLNQFGGSPVGTGGMFGQINLPQGYQPPGLGAVPPGGWAMNQIPGLGGAPAMSQGLGAMPANPQVPVGLPSGWNPNYVPGTMGVMGSGTPPPGYAGPIF